MYNLPTTVDPNKVFLIKRSELEKRLDSQFYEEEYSNLVKAIISYQHKRLSQITNFSSETWNQNDYYKDCFPYIEISEIELETGEIKNISWIKKEDAPSRARMIVRENDIIVSTTRPHRGAISKIQKETNLNVASTGFAIIRGLKSDNICREYLFFILRQGFCLKQMQQRSSGGNYPAITQEELGNILIPIPPLETQQIIITLYQTAYAAKQHKEAEAKALLESIDTYLLGELGISLPEQDNSLEKRIFTTKFSELGGRMDSVYFKTKHYKVEGGLFVNKKLKHLANIGKGQSITKGKVTEGEFPVVAGGQTSPYNHNEYNHKGNIITVSASGAYSGFVWYHDYPIFASDCCVIKSKNETAISTLFLAEILKLKQKEIYFLQQGAGQPHVYATDLAELQIPMPTPDKQEELIIHIQSIRSRAKALQHEATRVLEEAKREVEKMILGE